MSRFYRNWDERKCYDEGREDERFHRPDFEHDRYSSCSCDRNYFEGRADERRAEERREEERQQEEAEERRAMERRAEIRAEEEQMEADYFAQMEAEAERARQWDQEILESQKGKER